MSNEEKAALRIIYEFMVKGGASALYAKDLLMEVSPDGAWDSLIRALWAEFRQVEAGQGVMFK